MNVADTHVSLATGALKLGWLDSTRVSRTTEGFAVAKCIEKVVPHAAVALGAKITSVE